MIIILEWSRKIYAGYHKLQEMLELKKIYNFTFSKIEYGVRSKSF